MMISVRNIPSPNFELSLVSFHGVPISQCAKIDCIMAKELEDVMSTALDGEMHGQLTTLRNAHMSPQHVEQLKLANARGVQNCQHRGC